MEILKTLFRNKLMEMFRDWYHAGPLESPYPLQRRAHRSDSSDHWHGKRKSTGDSRNGSQLYTGRLFLTRKADQAGADAFLIVAPYYNKPSQEGLFAHFSEIAKRTEKPIVLYSIPSRCGIEISTDTVKRLRESHPHICALKEAGGRSSKVSETLVALDSDFTVLSGDDGLTLPFMACGAKGVVSVASNLIPQKVVSLVSLP